MKYHKIRNVPMEVCTAEQMIAYNLAQSSDYLSKQLRAAESKKLPASVISQFVHDSVFHLLKRYRSGYNYKNGRYNEDAIQCSLNAGLLEFLRKPFIATDYDSIGKAFPAYYF